ncbi:unnamed protein product [Cyprideis torosa]|uniref:Uncharacterized protein n=2 Tax=Cyprideis torosa TaxID=163714 RepID=A0A7R8W3D5_9CRUS|nr:unnamed protein product [Cyprideis torosa]CAG0880747.1 unnamed protein product [Cyprideis torosa]
MSSRSPYRSSLAISTDVPTLSRSQTPTPFRPTDWRLGGSRHSHEDEMDDVAELLALPTSVLSMSRPSKTDPEQLQVLIEAHHQMDRVEKFLERRRMMTPARSTTPSCSLSHGLRSSQVPSFNHYGSLRSRYSMQRDSPQPLSTSIARPLSSLGTSGSPYGSGSSGYASLMKSSRGTSGSICSLDDDGGSSVSGFSLASEDWSGTPGGASRSAYRSEYEEAKSAALTKNISEFLQRSDRALDRWRPGSVVPRSKPPAGRKQVSHGGLALPTKALEEVLGEVQADLAEEHSTCTMATERLENETAERMRLQQNSQELQSELEKVKRVNNQLEAEVSYSRAAAQINGDISPQDGDHLEDSGVYKLRYERAMRELEYMKSRLNSQHEQDMEKILTVKKQMERKVQDAVEEAEEQRQVVGQWKRKHGRLAGEAADLKHLLETQTGRNNLLEKKQRKFDHELQVAQDEIKSERRERERIQRERDTLNTEKFKLEQDYQVIDPSCSDDAVFVMAN